MTRLKDVVSQATQHQLPQEHHDSRVFGRLSVHDGGITREKYVTFVGPRGEGGGDYCLIWAI